MNRYLQQLTVRLATGVAELPESTRRSAAEFFLSAQRPDGGFAGREGESDPYYTAFGLRALAVLGELYGDCAQRACDFLRQRLSGHESLVDFFSLIYGANLLVISADVDPFADADAAWQSQVAEFLQRLRRDDGGYAKGLEGAASSTYQSFLVSLALNLMGQPIPDPERLVDFVLSQQGDDGGFREIRAAKRSGTNPTAAAIGTLRVLGFHDDDVANDAVDFLLDRQSSEGGLTANSRIPIADVLSTFTGMVTLADLGVLGELDLEGVEGFVTGLQQGSGGFLAAAWDEVVDVEYSFYGLGCLGLLAEHRRS